MQNQKHHVFSFFYFFVKYHMLCNCLKQNRLLCTSVSSIQTSNVIIHGQEATFFIDKHTGYTYLDICLTL